MQKYLLRLNKPSPIKNDQRRYLIGPKKQKGIETTNSHRDDFVDRDCDLARDLGVCDFDRDLCRDPLSNKHNTIFTI